MKREEQVAEANGEPIVDEEEFALVRTMKTKKVSYKFSACQWLVLCSDL